MRRHSSALSLFLVAAALALLAVACYGNGTGDTPSRTPTVPSTEQPSPTLRPVIRTTGIADLDAVFAAVRSGEPETVRRLIRFESRPCVTELQGLPAEPLCRDGEPEGSPVDVLALGNCEGHYSRPDELDNTLDRLVESSLYAVYEAPPEFAPPSEYVAIFSLDQSALNVRIAGDRITGISFGCAQTPEEMIEVLELENAVLPPP